MKKLFAILPLAALIGAGCASAPVPTSVAPSPAPSAPAQPTAQIHEVGCTPKALTVLEPAPGDTKSLPLSVKVRVSNGDHPDCRWTVFEGYAASMRLLDKDGVTVGAGPLTASGDWMTDAPVEFTGEIPALARIEGAATLIITEENPKGEGTPQEVWVPLTMEMPAATTTGE